VTEEEIKKMNEDSPEGQIRPTETLTTTAPQGASVEEVREGVRRVEAARASVVPDVAAASDPEPETQKATDEAPRPAAVPTRSKSRLAIWTRSKPEPTPSNISPYPGT
jgi:hypothetical protein